MPLEINAIRSQFPSLNRPAVFLDNPGGTQVCRASANRIQRYFMECNANHGGAFQTSRDSDAMIDETRQTMAAFLNAARPEEIVIGANMTTLTFAFSRALARTLQPGDTIVLTHLDHDANISPWLMAAEDRGCKIRWVNFHQEDGTLDLADMQAAMAEQPKIVAFGYASNALGTINPVQQITAMAHAAGALVYIDAVQYAPHGPIDVQELGVDFLVCSAYKFFGPHLGVLYGRYDLLDRLPAYRVRPAPQTPPGKFETGTGNFEHMAGLLGALEYIEWVGTEFGQEFTESLAGRYSGRALALKQGMCAIRSYEFELSQALLAALQSIPGLKLYGPQDAAHVDGRVPTFSFTLAGKDPLAVAQKLGDLGIYVWNGNFYALEITKTLGLEEHGGLVRVGAAHYNTLSEVELLRSALLEI